MEEEASLTTAAVLAMVEEEASTMAAGLVMAEEALSPWRWCWWRR